MWGKSTGSTKKSSKMDVGEKKFKVSLDLKCSKLQTVIKVEKKVFERSLEGINKVLQHVPLRKMIFDYVIRQRDAASLANFIALRFVSKFWQRSVLEYLRESGIPLFQVLLDNSNSVEGSAYVREKGKALDRFVSTLASSALLRKHHSPPFKLKITEDFFLQENFQSLKNCFENCGDGIVELDIEFPRDGGSMTLFFPDVKLPTLKSITVAFLDSKLKKSVRNKATVGSNVNSINFMLHLFHGCRKLQNLKVVGCSDKVIPHNFEYLIIPTATLTTLNLTFIQGTNKHLELLTRNAFPVLKMLSLRMPVIRNIPFSENGLIFKILNNVRTTLMHLYFEGVCHAGHPKGETKFWLPLMEELRTFDTNSTHLELHSGLSMLEKSVPKLYRLSLHNQTVPMFRKWVEASTFTTVKELIVSLVHENFAVKQEPKYYLNFGWEMMHQTYMAFPNIHTLEITACGTESCGLRYIFQNLKKLRILRVDFTRSDEVENSDHWDSLLTGIPLKWAVIFKAGPDDWNRCKFDYPSITSLTELQELDLRTWGSSVQPLLANSLISDASFHFAFLNMTKLEKITVKHRFMVSPEMQEKWKSQGRTISYEERYG